MQLTWLSYLAAFSAALAIAWTLTPLVLRFALRRQILDVPHAHKSHVEPVPYLGGVAIVGAFSLAVMGAAFIRRPPSGLDVLAAVLGLGILLALMGLIDDLRGLPLWPRLALEVAAGAAVWGLGSGVTGFPYGWLNLLITIVWVVGIANAFNMLDNMDGLSGGIAAIAAGFFFLIAALNGQFLVAALSAAVAGCALGFLRHNFHPAKIYMGDAGSLFLGFLLAVLGMRLRLIDTNPVVALFVPVFVLGMAVLDTSLVVVNRLRHARSPLLGGRDHISHRLVFIGIPVPVAVGLIYAGAVGAGWLALLLSRLDLMSGLILVGFATAVAVPLFGLLSSVPVYDNSRRRRTMLQVVKQHESEPIKAPADETARLGLDTAGDRA